MYRLFVLLTVLYLLGDPGMTLLSQAGGFKDLVVAFMLALVAIPWVATQFDN